MRNTPVMIYINKMDRETLDPFELLDDIEQKLKIRVRPLSWPIGMGNRFKGVYNLFNKSINLFEPDVQKVAQGLYVCTYVYIPAARASSPPTRCP